MHNNHTNDTHHKKINLFSFINIYNIFFLLSEFVVLPLPLVWKGFFIFFLNKLHFCLA